jgi:hypothetical protein
MDSCDYEVVTIDEYNSKAPSEFDANNSDEGKCSSERESEVDEPTISQDIEAEPEPTHSDIPMVSPE